MPQYKYTAVTQDNQKMTGSLSAANEEEARKELNELGLAILGIEETDTPVADTTPQPAAPAKTTEPPKKQEISITPTVPGEEKPEEPQKIAEAPAPTPPPTPKKEEPKKEEKKSLLKTKAAKEILTKFEFEGHDKTGRKIIGTIPATDRFSAYKRLIKEYQFEVKYIVIADAPQAEKDHAKEEGVADLQSKLEQGVEAEQEVDSEIAQDKDFKAKQKLLLEKVDYVLEKIKAVLVKFDKDIKPENKKLIQNYVDKLLRIKNSTNLEYIEHTAEELLKKIQKQEIFLHKEKFGKEKAELMIETEKMMSSLHSGSVTKTSIGDTLSDKVSKIKVPFIKKFFQEIGEKFKEDPEVTSVKSIIKSTNQQIITYLKIYIKSYKDKEAKKQVSESLKAVLTERQNLKKKLKELKTKKSVKAVQETTQEKTDTILSEVANFVGWLLSFYLIYYFLSYYFTTKDLPYALNLPWNPNIVSTPLIKYLVAIILIWYILLAAKAKFAPKKAALTPVVGLTGIILSIIIIFNF